MSLLERSQARRIYQTDIQAQQRDNHAHRVRPVSTISLALGRNLHLIIPSAVTQCAVHASIVAGAPTARVLKSCAPTLSPQSQLRAPSLLRSIPFSIRVVSAIPLFISLLVHLVVAHHSVLWTLGAIESAGGCWNGVRSQRS
jgi:hypothetical protein